jgi:hypothetical protein
MNTFIYVSNFSKSKKRAAEIWLGMARALYVESGRKMKSVSPDGVPEWVELMRPVIGENGEVRHENDLSTADFDVIATVGPSSATAKQAASRALMALMAANQDPELSMVLTHAILQNSNAEGIDDVVAYSRKKLLALGAVKPNEQEIEELQAAAQQGQPQDPNAVYLNAAAEEAQAKAAQANANVMKTLAEADKVQAQTAQINGELAARPMEQQGQPMQAAQAAQATEAPNSAMISMAHAIEALAEQVNHVSQRETPAPIVNVLVERGGSVSKTVSLRAPDGGVYDGTVTENEGEDDAKGD